MRGNYKGAPKASAGGSGGLTPDLKKVAVGSENKDLLKEGATYTGRVTEVSSTNTYTVHVTSAGQSVAGVVLASSIVSGMLGFQDSRVLAVGTPVAIACGNPPFIFAAFPSSAPDSTNGGNRSSAAGEPVSRVGDAGKLVSTNVAEDMVAGEFDIDNLFGVGMRFLTSLIAMKAGDRAKVECHLLNDMVRIVSQQFRHIHALGDELIFDHGRPTMEKNFSSYRHEVLGNLKDGDPFALNGDEFDKAALDEVNAGHSKRVHAAARSRYLEYMGFVGDFIHRFVCDPPATMVNMAEAHRAGKSWEHFGSDGSYILQSTAEIRFERVTKIPIFHRKASHEDPAVTKERRYRELKMDFLKAWDYGSYDAKNAYRTAYQLRLYARWLTRFQAYARALQLDSDYDVTSEAASPDPDWNNREEDRQSANADLEYFEAYSSYSILRDGSQVLHDGYGSSVVLSNGNVQLSASRHLELEAAGDIRVTCGGSFFLKARRHIEMSASAGGIILHSFAFLRGLCERGSIHLRSDAKPPGIGAADTPKSGVTPPIEPVVLDAAILLETTEGRFAIRAERQVSIAVERAPEDSEDRADDECDIILSTKGSLRVRAGKYVIIAALRDLITSSRHWATKVGKWYGDVGEVLWDKIYISPKSGTIQAKKIDTNDLRAATGISGPERGPLPPSILGVTIPVGPHSNHINLLQKSIAWKDDDDRDENANASLTFTADARRNPVSPWEKDAPDAKWEFLAGTDYYWDSREERKGALVQTLTQQYIIRDNPDFWDEGEEHYESWTWSTDKLQVTKRVGVNKVGFGGAAKQYAEAAGDNLHASTSKTPVALGTNSSASSWSANSVVMRTLKQNL